MCFKSLHSDAKGKFVGRFTVNTTYLIVGEPPSQGAAEAMRSYTDTINEAKRLAIRTISLPELKEQMGYRNPAKP